MTKYRTVDVDGLKVFYREAGVKEAPTLVFLHGFPSSSRMFEPLLQRLSDRWHLIAPDYPGFGHSEWPEAEKFNYTFDNVSRVMNRFIEVLGLNDYTLVMHGYGGPVGIRIAMLHPEKIRAMVFQNTIAHEAGFSSAWDSRNKFWKDRAANEAEFAKEFFSPLTTKARHLGSTPNPERINPDTFTDEQAFLSHPAQQKIQLDLFYDYRNNVEQYPKWHAFFEKRQFRTLVLWGQYDSLFNVEGAWSYQNEILDAEIYLLDAGHFLLDEDASGAAKLMNTFLEE